jgi:PAS domain S-box-containing protein
MKLATRLTVAMVALVLLTATAVGLLTYRGVVALALPRALDRIDTQARVKSVELETSFVGARADVSGFRADVAVNDIMMAHLNIGIDPTAAATEAEWRRRLALRFIAELRFKSNYYEFRYIGVDDGGLELVRVDRSGPDGAIRVVPENELHRTNNRDTFKEGINLPDGEVYVSPIDLNQKNGIIETPHVPVLRVATPIYTPAGRPFGIVIINVDMRKAFASIRSAASPDGNIYLVNERGDYLVHPDSSREFGFIFGNSVRVQDEFPEIAELLGRDNTAPRVVRDRAGEQFGVALEGARLAGGPRVTVIETMPYSRLTPVATAIGNSSLLGGLAAVLGGVALAVLLARSLTRPLAQMISAVEGLTRNEAITLPTHEGGEIGVLASAFARMAADMREKTSVLHRTIEERSLADEKFRLAVEASPSGLVMIDSSGIIVLVNAETERLFGYTRQDLIGQPVDILVPAGLRGHHTQHRVGFIAQPEARHMGAGRELYGLRKNGSEFPVEIGLNPIQTSHGLLVLSMIVDISERKRVDAALRDYAEREQLFIAAVESSNDAIVTKTLDGVITGWNQAAERLFGFTAPEAIGNSIDIIVPEELRSDVRGMLNRIRNDEKVEHHETVRTNKHGQRIDVSLSISPVKSSKGIIIGAAKVTRDITEKKRTQQALFESEQMARGIIDTAIDAFLQMNESGDITDWSSTAETMFGWSPQEVVGKKVRDLIVLPENRGAHSERLAEFLRSADNGSPGRRYESPSLRRDGKVIDTEISLTALRRRDGYVINGFIRDVTEQKAAGEHVRQAQKMESVGQLTGGIAHDFNNMLTVITGTIDILADAVADKPELAAITKLISEAADRGAELTGHLLAFARKQPLQPREIDVNGLMVDAVKLLRPTLGEQVEIDLKIDETACQALIDPAQLTTALLNLAVNARDAMLGGGKLTLETKNVVLDDGYAKSIGDIQPGSYVMIAVSDTGSGISEAIREKVFEPFFSTKEVGRGTGLGLSMVYGFVKQSGGHIKIYSEEGHGTTIRIYLPQAATQSVQLAAAPVSQTFESSDETVLIVEDDPLVRTYVTTQIKGLGYKTVTTANAAEALAVIEGGAVFDLLFTDVIMPGLMNGRQLAEEVKKRKPGAKVLFTSGYTEDAIIHHGRLDPGVLLLAKPYHRSDLARMLRAALGARPDVLPSGEVQRQVVNLG